MSNNHETGSLDRIMFPAEEIPRLLSNLLEALTATYEAVGMPRHAARRAALADLECDCAALPLAA